MKRIILFLILLIPINVYATELPELSSKKFIIYDNTTNEIINEKDSKEKTSIASLTKIMTTITAIEHIEFLDEEVTVTSEMLRGIYWNASKAGLKVGDKVTYKDLLYASMLPSGADATHVLAYSLSGGLNNFVNEMNKLAKEIGLENTNFSNVIGLDNINNYSTLSDVLKLLKYSLENQTFKEIYMTKEYYLTSGLLVESSIKKFNEKMGLDTSRIIGSKTGFTDNAGYCLSSLINSNDHEVIIITGGAKRIDKNFYHIIDTLNLITYTDEVISDKIAKLEEEKRLLALEQEKNRQEIEVKEKQDKKEKNQIYVNRTLVIGIVFLSSMFIIYICKPRKRRKR